MDKHIEDNDENTAIHVGWGDPKSYTPSGG